MQPHWQARINKTLQRDYQWQAFAQGSSNQLFKGINPDAPALVARINGVNTLTPGVNREREALLLDELQCHSWAPQIIHNNPAQGWCVMRCYKPLNATSLTATQQQQLLAAIAELQCTQPPNPDGLLTIDYHQLMLENYQSLAVRHNDRDILKQIAVFEHELATLPTLPHCLVHHDLHLGNLATTPLHLHEHVIILDWEYGGLGNAWFDLATLHRFLDIPLKHLIKLPAVRHLSDKDFHDGIHSAIQLSEMIDALWYWARAINQPE